MFSTLGVLLLGLLVTGGSIFLLGVGSLLRRRCTLSTCGTEAAREACAECPVARAGSGRT